MKKSGLWWLAGAAALLFGGFLPHGTDAAQLLPVTALYVDLTADGTVTLDCDADVTGSGKSLPSALDDLCLAAPGELFLQTAQQLVFTPAALKLLPQAVADERLRPAAQVYVLRGEVPDMDAAAEYLQAHPGGVTLAAVRAAELGAGDAPLPVLLSAEGRLTLHGA